MDPERGYWNSLIMPAINFIQRHFQLHLNEAGEPALLIRLTLGRHSQEQLAHRHGIQWTAMGVWPIQWNTLLLQLHFHLCLDEVGGTTLLISDMNTCGSIQIHCSHISLSPVAVRRAGNSEVNLTSRTQVCSLCLKSQSDRLSDTLDRNENGASELHTTAEVTVQSDTCRPAPLTDLRLHSHCTVYHRP
ncbi:hypothetical protein WMY93_013144 [Mugilogobius chulae]|uniref:Uncharacterized protein n=1 Tax=Mugilogobius chulae TaxID=88201 RepID=A0AAW0NZH0_9GOBI